MSRKTVLITGCSGTGIGYHLSLAFHAAGCQVFVTARDLTRLHDLPGDIEKVALDVTDAQSVAQAVQDVEERAAGRIDILVNNAGQGCVGPLAEVPMERAQATFDSNVFGLLRMSQAVSRTMIKNRTGLIVNISSIVSFVPTPWAGIYCATKACVTSLSDVLRMELAGFNVGVMCVFPGAIRSNIGSKNAAAFSQAPESNYGNVTDQVIKRAQWSQCPSSTPADKLAQEIVDAALSSRPPAYLSAGYRATRAWWSFYLPYWLKDYFWGSQFGTASVGKW